MKSVATITPVASLSVNGNTHSPSHLPGASTTQAAACSAFCAGMQVLQRYAHHSTADPVAIAKDNMRLLHNALLNDLVYRQMLKQANHNTARLPTLHGLLMTQGLQADLITVRKGHSIRLTSHQGNLSMFMAISGKAIIEQRTQSNDRPIPSLQQHKPWWRRLRREKQTVYTLKNGDVVLISPGWNEGKVLNARGQNCVILSVSLPLATPKAA
jgi:hypothetical protein